MADEAKVAAEEAPQAAEGPQLEGGAYEVLRNRLTTLNRDLRDKLNRINDKRKEVFGGKSTEIVGNERIRTENNCVARDIIAIGNRLIFGYNVFLGLKTEAEVTDVFSVFRFDNNEFREEGLDLIGDQTFKRDFGELYKFYKRARFLQFYRTHKRLLFVFQIGDTVSEIKVFRWEVNNDDTLTYIDDRGEMEYQLPAQHEFTWTVTGREDQVAGEFPHVSIQDKVYVECVGGDLTIKLEDNTASGQGIYSEPVEQEDQTLDDAEISYAFLGNMILLRVKPYLEGYRYLIFNRRTEEVVRVDSVGQACVQLPEDHGVIFPRGFYLQNGTFRKFDQDVSGMVFLESHTSPNGEDFLYVFYHADSGRYILIQYNLIAKEISNPIYCHGYSLYDDGTMVLFNAPDDEPKRVHPMQIWMTPFYSELHEEIADTSSYLYKIGNRDLVRCMSDCHAVTRLIGAERVTLLTYQDIVRDATKVLDTFLWLEHEEVFNLKALLTDVKAAAVAAVGEYEKVVRIRRNTEQRIAESRQAVEECLKTWQFEKPQDVQEFVTLLDRMRSQRGQVISLRDLRYADLEAIDTLEQQLATAADEVSEACVQFLLQETALAPYVTRLSDIEAALDGVTKITELKEQEEALSALSAGLDLLTEIVNNLTIEDATQTARIVDTITEVYAGINRVKAIARNIRQDLSRTEAVAEFGAQYNLLTQSITNFIGLCDTPEKCDDYLTKVMVTIEELEGRFADFDEFAEKIAEKREEAYTAFSNRKQVLDEEKKRRIGTLMASADRVLKGIGTRAGSLGSVDEVNGYFASDLMVTKLRDTIERLRQLGDSVKAEELSGRLKNAKTETLRKLRDTLDLFSDGDNIINLGGYKFTVNTQPLNLTTVLHGDGMCFHLTGTDFYEEIEDEELLATRDLWNQTLVSENRDVYRGEFLAYDILRAAIANQDGLTLESLRHTVSGGDLAALIREQASGRYEEGYEKGIHDHDATRILTALLQLYEGCGLLRYDSASRACAMLFWAYFADIDRKERWQSKLKSFGARNAVFGCQEQKGAYVAELREGLAWFFDKLQHPVEPMVINNAAEFLFYALQVQDELVFAVNNRAAGVCTQFLEKLEEKAVKRAFLADLESQKENLKARLDLTLDWIGGFCGAHLPDTPETIQLEAAVQILTDRRIKTRDTGQAGEAVVDGLMGQHRLIREKQLPLRLDAFLLKMRAFVEDTVPKFRRFMARRKALSEQRREDLRLEEFQSQVMGSFVRNKLINDVYLKMVGANFAKQMGATGAGKRTDLMGLLLLISPPGYGKTTLMEYMANRLGLTFMKINGPAIGHQVTSLDPREAPNATAREELNKLNLAFEMGNNVMIYLDDIQHCNPELLQKFISLCDAQRKVEGVFRGVSRTYDLRGKKVAVVMAGNPYTESGEKFKIPDMLANRADTYNLGDVTSGSMEVFALSFIENAMTSNPALSKIASHGHDDVYQFFKILDTGSQEGVEFSYPYGGEEVQEILSVLAKMRRIQQIVLKVNAQYIASAAQADEYRTEPPFKMQGSYRNMNRMAEKVYPVMTDEEVDQIIIDHYYNEAQTLTTGAEANLLKFKEIMGCMEEADSDRWEEIKREFNRRKLFVGMDEGDQMAQILAQLSGFNAGMGDIKAVLEKGVAASRRRADEGEQRVDFTPLIQALHKIQQEQAQGRDQQGGALELLGELEAKREAAMRQLIAAMQEQQGGALGKMAELQAERDAFMQQLVAAVQEQGKGAIEELQKYLLAAQHEQQDAQRHLLEEFHEHQKQQLRLARQQEPPQIKMATQITPEIAQTWERQTQIVEALVPMLNTFYNQNDVMLEFKELFHKLFTGKIEVKLNR